MNSAHDAREIYFKNKVSGLMVRPNVVKAMTTPHKRPPEVLPSGSQSASDGTRAPNEGQPVSPPPNPEVSATFYVRWGLGRTRCRRRRWRWRCT